MNANPKSSVALVVEDEWLLREQAAEALRCVGWVVLEAASAERALAFRDEGVRVDLVVTDIRLLGELNGWDVAEAFRADDPCIPVIYTSGDRGAQSRRVPGSIFLSKPYRQDTLLEACRSVADPPSEQG